MLTHTDKYTHIFYFQLPVVCSGECQTLPPRPSKCKNPQNKRVQPLQNVYPLIHTHRHTPYVHAQLHAQSHTHHNAGPACEVEGDRAVHAAHTVFIFVPSAWQPATFFLFFPTSLFLSLPPYTFPLKPPICFFHSFAQFHPPSCSLSFFNPTYFVSPPSNSLNVI